MKITDALRGEHGVFYAQFERIRKAIDDNAPLDELQGATRTLAAALLSHATIENTIFFPALEPSIGGMGPLAVMRHEHGDIEGGFLELDSVQDIGVLRSRVAELMEYAIDHFAKEENILFPLAERSLDAQRLDELGSDWAEARGVTLADRPMCG
ncbi:MAG: hemerythrin domain-containing protein [Deltaproteobacteria bacterium]|nr:hemerythrin domain-containing protein [Deltaproteobacteria bacterium]